MKGDAIILVTMLKALADESRLRIVGLLADAERPVGQIASRLGLTPPTVSHHLSRLKAAGLISMRSEGVSHLYRLDVDALHELSRALLARETVESLASNAEQDPWERKVLRDFLVDGQLKQIPANRKKREVVLRWLADQFQIGRRYPEREVNAIIKRHHEDTATLRRELIGAQLLTRENGVYWRREVLGEPASAADGR